MKKTCLLLLTFLLSGCIDPVPGGLHPELKVAYFDGHKQLVENCLYDSAISQHLSLIPSDLLPGGSDRFYLQNSRMENVASLDVSDFGNNQTSVDFFYAPHTPELQSAISAMITYCKK